MAKGIADAFYYPAQAAILPRIVEDRQLRHANAIIQTTTESSGFVGPMLAGALIAYFSGTNNVTPSLDSITAAARTGTSGVGLAFAVVAAVFLISFLLLVFLQMNPELTDSADKAQGSITEEEGGERSGPPLQRSSICAVDAAMFTLFSYRGN